MAMSHDDSDSKTDFINKLTAKADEMSLKGRSQIASGKPGESELAHWQSNGVDVSQLPDDDLGILRISIGGGETPVPLNYCRFRGNHAQCVDLLRKALRAMEAGGN